jgi:hypothetical protein
MTKDQWCSSAINTASNLNSDSMISDRSQTHFKGDESWNDWMACQHRCNSSAVSWYWCSLSGFCMKAWEILSTAESDRFHYHFSQPFRTFRRSNCTDAHQTWPLFSNFSCLFHWTVWNCFTTPECSASKKPLNRAERSGTTDPIPFSWHQYKDFNICTNLDSTIFTRESKTAIQKT